MMYFNRETRRYEKGGPGLPEKWEDYMFSEKVALFAVLLVIALAASIV